MCSAYGPAAISAPAAAPAWTETWFTISTRAQNECGFQADHARSCLLRITSPLRRPVGDPRTCAARRGNAVHGGISAVSRGGTLLHVPVGRSPAWPLDEAIPHTQEPPPRYCQKSAKSAGRLPLPYSGFSCDFGSPYKRTAPMHKRPPMRISRPPAIHKKPQSPQAHISQIPMRLGSPYGPRSHTFPRLPHATSKLQKSRHWFR